MAERRRRKKGKILKVRLGYNANSSSLSAIVSLVMLGSAAVTAVLGMIGAALFTRADKQGSAGTTDAK